MRTIIFLFTFLPSLIFAQTSSPSVCGRYVYSDGRFYYQLELRTDSTFSYQHSFKLGTTESTGRWTFGNDTLILSEYRVPWKIEEVEERVVDTLSGRVVVEVIANFGDTKRRGRDEVYIDGQATKVNMDSKRQTEVVGSFELWINNHCTQPQRTDSLGRTVFLSNEAMQVISFDYDSYFVKNPLSNYFLLTLTNYPIPITPPTLTWTTWILRENSLSPIECRTELDTLKLER